MSRPVSTRPSSAPTPAPSSPPISESFLSELDGTAPSILDSAAGDILWDGGKVDPTTLNLVSWKLDVNARSEDGLEKRGFNAISTVLNHPTRKANPLRASRKPLPPLTQAPPVIPKPPPPSHYDAYLKIVTPLYESYVNAQASSSSLAQFNDFDNRPADKGPTNLPPLDSVPDLFFESTFDISNPITWADIMDNQEAGPSSVVQDTLSGHLDTLERHLMREITLRSTSFFSALSNLQDLHSESASCLNRISSLQTSLKEVGSHQARKGLAIIDAHEDLRVLRVTEKGVETVGELEELVKVAKRLVEDGDWSRGLGCLEDIVRWWERYGGLSEQPAVEPIVNGDQGSSETREATIEIALPLSTLPALAHLPAAISTLTTAVSSQLQTALSSRLLSLLSSADTNDSFRDDEFRSSIQPILSGLVRCGNVDVVETVWREVMTTTVREGSRKHLPVAPAEDDGEEDIRPAEQRGASLAQSLKAMGHADFLLLSAQMYGTLLARLQLAQKIGGSLAAILRETGPLSPLRISLAVPDSTAVAPATHAEASLDLSDVLTSACELANSRASKIIAVRSEQHAVLSLSEFVEMFKESWEFVLATESLATRMIVPLRGVTASQARAFLVSYHATRLTKSAKLVEEEQWSQVDVSSETQHAVDIVIQSAVSDPDECFIPPRPPDGVVNGNGTTQPGKQLMVEDKAFFVVKATAETIELLGDYLKIVVNLELVVTDVMSRIIEYLKSFNSRTCQVVLGAGAMRSAGLKNITAKHLALASQSLSAIVALIPYIREFIRRHLNPKQAVMLTEFDKLKRDYQEHQNEIHAKLVAIMSDRLAVHVGSLRDINWETTPEKDGPRPYAELLVKETATLHKVLSKYLSAQTVESVMSEVLAAIVHRLSEEYAKVELKSEEAKKRMTQDVLLISTKLSPLSESGSSVKSLETVVREKSTPRKPMGQAMKGFLRRGASGSNEVKRGVEAGVNGDMDAEVEVGQEDEDGLGIVAEPEEVRVEGTVEGEDKDAVNHGDGQEEASAGGADTVEEVGGIDGKNSTGADGQAVVNPAIPDTVTETPPPDPVTPDRGEAISSISIGEVAPISV